MNPGNAGRRIALGLAVAAGTLGATAGAALAAPRARVTPSINLDRAAPNAISVEGTGFTADVVSQSTGLYAAVTAVVDGSIVYDQPNGQYLRDGFPPGPMRLNGDGSFSTVVTVNRRFTLGPTEVDCATTQCFLTTWRAHGAPDASNTLTQQALVFAAAAPGTPEVTVAPRTELPRDGQTTVTVSGSGFDPNDNNGLGLYVAYGPKTADFWTRASTFGATKWVYPGAPVGPARDVLGPDGSFRTTLNVSPTYTTRDGTTYDCRVIECAVLTFAAHGSTDRSWDTTAPVTFAPLPPEVVASPTTGLNRDGATTVSVKGSRFTTGAYVSVTAIVDGQLLSDQANARWIRRTGGPTPADTLNADGSFDTTLTVNPTFSSGTTTVDCRVTQCAISTWRQHSNPTPTTLLTSTNVTFAAAPVDPPIDPPPAVKAPVVKPFAKAQRIAKNRTAKIAVITCGTADCKVGLPKSVTFKIGKKRYRATVAAPKSVKAGKRAEVRVKLTKAAVKALKGRKAKVKVKVTVTADGKRTAKTATVTIAGGKKAAAKKGAAKRA